MNKDLHNGLALLFQRSLRPAGFSFQKIGQFTRCFPEIEQAVEVFEHRDRFSVRLHWRYLVSPLSRQGSFSYSRGLNSFPGMESHWFPAGSSSEVETGLEKLCVFLETQALPFLDRYTSVERIVEAVESGLLPARAFGTDPINRLITKGACLVWLGKFSEAKSSFEAALSEAGKYEDLSDVDREWLAYAKKSIKKL